MTNATDSFTSATLLLRLRDLEDKDAWEEFVERYGRRIFAWCRRSALQDTDAADVTQEVLTKLVQTMRAFEYDPERGSFRAWLKTVTNNAARDFARSLTRLDVARAHPFALERLAALQTPDAWHALASTLQEECERELLREAETRVRMRVKPHTWRVYQMTAVESQKATAVAEQLHMTVAEVYVAKSRVIRMLREEVEKLSQSPLYAE